MHNRQFIDDCVSPLKDTGSRITIGSPLMTATDSILDAWCDDLLSALVGRLSAGEAATVEALAQAAEIALIQIGGPIQVDEILTPWTAHYRAAAGDLRYAKAQALAGAICLRYSALSAPCARERLAVAIGRACIDVSYMDSPIVDSDPASGAA